MGAAAFFPHVLHPNFLEPAFADEILASALEQQALFQMSRVGNGPQGREEASIRRSLVLGIKREAKDRLRQQVMDHLPALLDAVGMKIFPVAKIEVQMAAHGDGDFYKRHLDTFTGPDRPEFTRRLSLVLHLFQRPRAFSGGALRLYSPIGGSSYDLEPDHNRLVGFPSFIPHEVMPINLPGNDFASRRFAINLWVRG